MFFFIRRRKHSNTEREKNVPVHLDEIKRGSADTTASTASTTDRIYQNVKLDTSAKTVSDKVYQNADIMGKRKGKII